MPPDRVRLADGTTVFIRPIEPRDKHALELGLEGMSRESRYFRFFAPIDHLSRAQLRYLTEVDHHDHEALVAFSGETGEPVGVARFVRLADEADAAEAAVAVMDHWQRRGVGTELLRRLAERATAEGVERFIAIAIAENQAVRELMSELGPAEARAAAPGTVEIRIELPADADRHTPLRSALRRAADGTLAVVGAAGRGEGRSR